MSATAVPTALLDSVCTAFREEVGATLYDPAQVHDRCQPVSEAFAARCQAVGLDAEVLSGVRFGEIPQFTGIRVILAGHFAVRVRAGDTERVYDWTARQFDPEAAVPTVYTPQEWTDHWEPLSGGSR